MASENVVPHQASWELYHNSFSICSTKVRICLHELDVPYRAHHVHLIETGSYETVSRAFLAVNPLGTVPMLLHEGHRIYESHAQIAYAAKHAAAQGNAKGLGLLPSDQERRRHVERWTDRASIVGKRPISPKDTAARAGNCVAVLTLPLFATMVHYIPYREIARGLLTHPQKERPLLFLLLRWLGIVRLPLAVPLMRVIGRARVDLHGHLDAVERELSTHGLPFLCGEAFTLADVSWAVLFERLEQADWSSHFLSSAHRPHVAAYWERVSSRPSLQAEGDAAACNITRRGIADLRDAKRQHPTLKRALEGAADEGTRP